MSFFGTIGRIAGGLLRGGPVGGVTTAATLAFGRGTPGSQMIPPAMSAREMLQLEATDAHARADIPCRSPGLTRTSSGACVPQPGFAVGGTQINPMAMLPFGKPLFSPVAGGHMDQFGDAVMGRYGVALQPGVRQSQTHICPPGSKLGRDMLCYDKIANGDRRWPRGTRPLLTGGDMNAIRRASSAAKKLERTNKKLQTLGLLKKPASRRAPPRRSSNGKGITVIDTD